MHRTPNDECKIMGYSLFGRLLLVVHVEVHD